MSLLRQLAARTAAYHMAYGLLERFPICCVIFFSFYWIGSARERRPWTDVYAGQLPRVGFVPCPRCLERMQRAAPSVPRRNCAACHQEMTGIVLCPRGCSAEKIAGAVTSENADRREADEVLRGVRAGRGELHEDRRQ